MESIINHVSSLLCTHLLRLSALKEQRELYSSKFQILTSTSKDLEDQISRMLYLNQLSSAITSASAMDFQSMFETIVSHASSFFNADRATLFLRDDKTKPPTLYSLAGGTEIRTSLDTGVVGHVAMTNSTLNIADAYRDPRFNRDVDLKTGYSTKTILAGALTNFSGEVIGVLQLINKRDGAFTSSDEKLMSEMFNQVGPFITSHIDLMLRSEMEERRAKTIASRAAEDLQLREERVRSTMGAKEDELLKTKEHLLATKALLDLSACFASNLSTLSVFDEAVVVAPHVLKCDRATLFLIDETKPTKELYSFTKTPTSLESTTATLHSPSGRSSPVKDRSEIRFPVNAGIAGFVASTSKVLNLPDAYEDPRFNKDIDLRTGYRTKSIICGPVCDSTGKIIGVLQAMNKINTGEGDIFTEDDEILLQKIMRMVGGAVEKCVFHDKFLHKYDLTLAKERIRTAKAEKERRLLQGETRLLQVTDKLSSDLELRNLFENVVKHVPFALSAERATLFLYNKATNELSSRSTSNEGQEVS